MVVNRKEQTACPRFDVSFNFLHAGVLTSVLTSYTQVAAEVDRASAEATKAAVATSKYSKLSIKHVALLLQLSDIKGGHSQRAILRSAIKTWQSHVRTASRLMAVAGALYGIFQVFCTFLAFFIFRIYSMF